MSDYIDELTEFLILEAIGVIESNIFISQLNAGISNEMIQQFHDMNRESQEILFMKMVREKANEDIILALLMSISEGINFDVNTPVQAHNLLFECAEFNNLVLAKKLLDAGIDLDSEMEGIGAIYDFKEKFPRKIKPEFASLIESYKI